MEEGASASGDHVKGLADHAPLVVVKIAAQVEQPVRLKAEAAGREHALARRVPVAQGKRRVRCQKDDAILRPFRPAD